MKSDVDRLGAPRDWQRHDALITPDLKGQGEPVVVPRQVGADMEEGLSGQSWGFS